LCTIRFVFDVLGNPEIKSVSSNTLAQLTKAGWDIFEDQDAEARVRSWLPANPTTANIEDKLNREKLAGVLVIKQGARDEIEFILLDSIGGTIFTPVQYMSD